jgi:ABC-type multidrug transport system fused ATPase/permease subunit
MSSKKNKVNNIIRNFFNDILSKNFKEKFLGTYYFTLHGLIMFLGLFILLFSTNKFYLILLLIIASCDAFAIIVLHQCPLTMLEKKYLGKNISEERMKLLSKLGIVYKCNHVYEYHLEILINMISVITIKIFFLICMNMVGFNIFSIK